MFDERMDASDQLTLSTVGIDIGSATTHLAFSRVYLRRVASNLSSRFMVVGREIISESAILLTPFVEGMLIDVDVLREFIESAYRQAGIAYSDIDSGAVLLTGRALERRNSRAVADLFAELAGGFVCAEAGHLLEAELAAHGSGAVAVSERSSDLILNVDIGGGTTKISSLRGGRLLSTAAYAVGGRLIVWDEADVVERLEWPIEQVGRHLGIELALGSVVTEQDKERLADCLAGAVRAIVGDEGPSALPLIEGTELWLTEATYLGEPPVAVLFSGGVSEYIYEPETPTFGDLSSYLAKSLRRQLHERHGAIELLEAHERIRATVIGASQFSTQVSGNTILISDPQVLPIRNLPIVRLPNWVCEPLTDPEELYHTLVASARRRVTAAPGNLLGVSLKWIGRPEYRRLHGVAYAIAAGLQTLGNDGLVLLCDADVGRTLGRIISSDLGFKGPVVALDGLEIGAFDFVDVGVPFEDQDVVPVTVKSLLFS